MQNHVLRRHPVVFMSITILRIETPHFYKQDESTPIDIFRAGNVIGNMSPVKKAQFPKRVYRTYVLMEKRYIYGKMYLLD